MAGNPVDEQNVNYTYDLVGSGGVNIPCGSFFRLIPETRGGVEITSPRARRSSKEAVAPTLNLRMLMGIGR
jgi:hypothetical protein